MNNQLQLRCQISTGFSDPDYIDHDTLQGCIFLYTYIGIIHCWDQQCCSKRLDKSCLLYCILRITLYIMSTAQLARCHHKDGLA